MLHVAAYWKATIHVYNLKKFQKIQNLLHSQEPTQNL